MTDRDALKREMHKATLLNRDALWPDIAADIALRHIAAARAEALEEAAQKCERLAAMNPRPSKQAAAHVLADAIRALMEPPT